MKLNSTQTQIGQPAPDTLLGIEGIQFQFLKMTRGRTVFYIQKICFFDRFTRKNQTRIITHRRNII